MENSKVEPLNIFVTIGGSGTRLKTISPLDKHLLYYRDKKIIDCIQEICPAKLLGSKKTLSRKETLLEIKDMTNVVIIDCDIIPFGLKLEPFNKDKVYVFNSHKKKYGSVIIEDNKIVRCDERENISTIKCSGVYCIKNINTLLKRMTDDNSIISGMIGAEPIFESTFFRFGDVEDYYESIQQ